MIARKHAQRELDVPMPPSQSKVAFLWGDLDQDQRSKICLDHGESMTRVDSSVPSMHHDPDRSWITDPDPDHPKGTHPKSSSSMYQALGRAVTATTLQQPLFSVLKMAAVDKYATVQNGRVLFT